MQQSSKKTLGIDLVCPVERYENTLPRTNFGLSAPFVKLIQGQKYVVNSLNEEDIKYTNITIKIAQIISVSPDVTNIIDAGPENPDTVSLGAPIDLTNSGGGTTGFIMPSNLPSGNYILYVYIPYPYGITGVFSNLAAVGGSNNNNGPIGSNGQGTDFRPICNTLQIAFYHSCSELVNSDGSLTLLGATTVKYTLSGAAIGGISSFVLPPGIVIKGLSTLAGPSGCGGLVKNRPVKFYRKY